LQLGIARGGAGDAVYALLSDVEQFYSERHTLMETTTRQFDGPCGTVRVRVRVSGSRSRWC